MKIKVLYFAQLADLAKKAEEIKFVYDSSISSLYTELKNTTGRKIPPERVTKFGPNFRALFSRIRLLGEDRGL